MEDDGGIAAIWQVKPNAGFFRSAGCARCKYCSMRADTALAQRSIIMQD